MPVTAVLRDLNKLNTFVRVAQCQSFTKPLPSFAEAIVVTSG